MKTPDHIQIEFEDKEGYRIDLKKALLSDLKEVTASVRFSKKHYRYHTYKVSKGYSDSITLEKPGDDTNEN